MSAPTNTERLKAPALLRFDEPAPSVPRTQENREQAADALRTRPGVWALLGQVSSSGAARQYAYEIRRALHTCNACFAPDGAFETEARTLQGEHRVYARYVGPDGGDDRV